MRPWLPLIVLAVCLPLPFPATEAWGLPQYADWISQKSGIPVDCAYCHINSQGPLGNDTGQEGSLDASDLKALHTAHSPVLNAFGQSIIQHEGLDKFRSYVATPAKLAQDMKAYDLDGDGVTDGVEMEQGTLADDPLSAPPSLVWTVRLKQQLSWILLILTGAVVGAFGLWRLSRLLSD